MPYPNVHEINSGIPNARTRRNVIEATQRVKNEFYSPNVAPVTFHRAYATAVPMYPAVTTSAITPFNTNTNTYGTGSVTVLMPALNSNTNTVQSVANPQFNSNSTCYNNYTNNGANISNGVQCQVYICNGFIMFGGGDC